MSVIVGYVSKENSSTTIIHLQVRAEMFIGERTDLRQLFKLFFHKKLQTINNAEIFCFNFFLLQKFIHIYSLSKSSSSISKMFKLMFCFEKKYLLTATSPAGGIIVDVTTRKLRRAGRVFLRTMLYSGWRAG